MHVHTIINTLPHSVSDCTDILLLWGQVPIQLLCLSHTQMLPATHTYGCWHWGLLVSIRGLDECDTHTCSVPGTGLGHAVILPRNCNYTTQRHKCALWRTAAEMGSTTVHNNLRCYNVRHYISQSKELRSEDNKKTTSRGNKNISCDIVEAHSCAKLTLLWAAGKDPRSKLPTS